MSMKRGFDVICARVGIAVAVCALVPGVAGATTATQAISATVQATCLVTATSLAFGTYSGVQTDSTGGVAVTCTNTTPYNVGLSAGLGAAPVATVSTRHMTGPAAANLNYALFSDSGRTTNWGTTIATDTVAGVGNGSSQNITVYGRVAAAQYVAPGAYTDTVTATVTY